MVDHDDDLPTRRQNTRNTNLQSHCSDRLPGPHQLYRKHDYWRSEHGRCSNLGCNESWTNASDKRISSARVLGRHPEDYSIRKLCGGSPGQGEVGNRRN